MRKQIFVSPIGNGWDGTEERPCSYGFAFKTLNLLLEKPGYLEGVDVIFRGGTYYVGSGMSFNATQNSSIRFMAYPGEKPVFIGGSPISVTEGTYNGMRAWFGYVPEAAAGKKAERCNVLLCGGQRRSKTRLPKTGTFRMERVPNIDFDRAKTDPNFRVEMSKGTDTFICAEGDIQNWHNMDDVELVVLHYWVEERMPIASFNPETRMVVTKNFSSMSLSDDSQGLYARYYVENVKEALSEPGQWYLDKKNGELIYLPLEGETIEECPIVLPKLTKLLDIDGADNLTFEGLEWNGADRVTKLGYSYNAGVPLAATSQSAAQVAEGMVELKNCAHVAFRSCSFLNGDNFGISIGDGARQILFDRCEIAHMGAGGLRINGAANLYDPGFNRVEGLPTGWVTVTNCHIHNVGLSFLSASHILVMNATHNVFSHNELHDGGYTAIAMGWMWGYGESINANNIVEYNHIYDLGKYLLSDFGGIYTLGNQVGTFLRGNVIHDIERATYGGWGIYPDEGSAGMVIEGNFIYNCTGTCFHQHYGRENIVRDNVFICTNKGDGCAILSRPEGHNSITFTNNVFITDGTRPYFLGGGDVRKPEYRSDLNLFWCVDGREPAMFAANGGADNKGVFHTHLDLDREGWSAAGQDHHSVFGDPGFAAGDWSKPNTELLAAIDFKVYDWDRAGIED